MTNLTPATPGLINNHAHVFMTGSTQAAMSASFDEPDRAFAVIMRDGGHRHALG